MEINSVSEAKQAAQIYASPDTTEEQKQQIVAALHEFKARNNPQPAAPPPQQEVAAPQQQEAPAAQETTPPPQEERSGVEKAIMAAGDTVWDAVRFGQDTALFLGAGAAATVAGGIAGAWSALDPKEKLKGKSRMEHAAEVQRKVQESMMYRPRTELLQKGLQVIADPAEKVDRAVLDFSGEVANLMTPLSDEPNPLLATSIYTTIWSIPEVLGLKGSTVAKLSKENARQLALIRGKQRAKEMGIDFKRNERLGGSVVEAGRRMATDHPSDGAKQVMDAVARKRERARRQKNKLYDELEGSRAQTSVRATTQLAKDIEDVIAREFKGDMSKEAQKTLRSVLDDLADLGKREPMARSALDTKTPRRKKEVFTARVGNILALRKRLSQSAKDKGDFDATVLNRAKHMIDDFLDDGMEAAAKVGLNKTDSSFAVSGPASHIEAINDARKFARTYYQTFDDDALIKSMVKNNWTPQDFVVNTLGTSTLGVKKGALRNVEALKRILGDKSPEFDAIRGSMVHYVMEPLLQSKPNLRMFSDRYGKFIRKNPELVKALDLPTEDLDFLAKAADMAANMPDPGRMGVLKGMSKADVAARLLAVETMGSGLAKKALRVTFARNLMGAAFNSNRISPNQVIAGIAGVDPSRSLIKEGTKTWGVISLAASPFTVLDEIGYNPEDYQNEKDVE